MWGLYVPLFARIAESLTGEGGDDIQQRARSRDTAWGNDFSNWATAKAYDSLFSKVSIVSHTKLTMIVVWRKIRESVRKSKWYLALYIWPIAAWNTTRLPGSITNGNIGKMWLNVDLETVQPSRKMLPIAVVYSLRSGIPSTLNYRYMVLCRLTIQVS